MIIALHVIFALLSILASSVAVLLPSNKKLKLSYALVGSTLISGFYLVWSTRVHILQVCLTGLIYLSIVSVLLLFARFRLASANNLSR